MNRLAREAALARAEGRLRRDPQSLELALDRARLLGDLDRSDEARDAYMRVIARDPDQPRALTDFGTFLLRGGFRVAARTVYERAAGLAPSALTHTNLANVLFALGEFAVAREQYEAALRFDAHSLEAHQGLSYALTRLGREGEAVRHRQAGFARRPVWTADFRGSGAPIDVVQIVSSAGGTFYTDEILDDRIFRVTTVVADFFTGEALPPGHVLLNAISDADRARAELAIVAELVARDERTPLNAPARVMETAREANAARLAGLDGVSAPRVATFRRDVLATDGAALLRECDCVYPVLLRAPGFHTGQHFVRVDAPDDLSAAVASLPGDDLLVMAFVDLRDAGGLVRKYRVMIVDGNLYPLHLAIARDWKVHYFTADMADNAEFRAEEERFLNDPAAAIGTAAMAALGRVRDLLALDVAGIDFGIDAQGRVVVFEANATMIVLPPGPEPIWDYRRPHAARVIAAARTMLADRAMPALR